MAKKPPARKTAEQLKTMVWENQGDAERDIKASGVPLGDDSELREYRPGSWQIMPIAAPEAPVAEDREGAVLDNLRKKPGAKPRGEATVIAEAKAPEKKARAKAAAIDGNGKKDHRDQSGDSTRPTASSKRPSKSKPKAAPKPVKPDPRPGVVGIAPKTLENVVPFQPKSEPEKPPAADLFLPLPKDGRPYTLAIVEGSSEAFPDYATHTTALDVARRLRAVVLVNDKDGMTVRRYDPAEFMRKAPRASSGSGSGSRAKADGPGENSKFGKASKLLFREQGATAKELEAATGWVGVTQRHINRASKLNNDARIEHIGSKHWRLVKRGG